MLAVFGVFCAAGLGLVAVRARKRVGALIGTDHRYDALKSFEFAPASDAFTVSSTFNMLTGSPTERTPRTTSPGRPDAGTGGRGGPGNGIPM